MPKIIVAEYEEAKPGQIVMPRYSPRTWGELRTVLNTLLDDETPISSINIDGKDPGFSAGYEAWRPVEEPAKMPLIVTSHQPSYKPSEDGQPVKVVNPQPCNGLCSTKGITDCRWCCFPDITRYCIGCRGEHKHCYNPKQLEYECGNCGLLALDEPAPRG